MFFHLFSLFFHGFWWFSPRTRVPGHPVLRREGARGRGLLGGFGAQAGGLGIFYGCFHGLFG